MATNQATRLRLLTSLRLAACFSSLLTSLITLALLLLLNFRWRTRNYFGGLACCTAMMVDLSNALHLLDVSHRHSVVIVVDVTSVVLSVAGALTVKWRGYNGSETEVVSSWECVDVVSMWLFVGMIQWRLLLRAWACVDVWQAKREVEGLAGDEYETRAFVDGILPSSSEMSTKPV